MNKKQKEPLSKTHQAILPIAAFNSIIDLAKTSNKSITNHLEVFQDTLTEKEVLEYLAEINKLNYKKRRVEELKNIAVDLYIQRSAQEAS